MRRVLTALLLLVGAERAAAQMCVGNSNFSLSHFHSSVDVDIDNLAHLYTAEFRYRYQDFCCGSQSFTLLSLGVGLGFSDEITLIPAVSWPLGDVGRTSYAIVASFRLGKGI